MKINIFIYYGAVIDKVDYENLTNKLGIVNLYNKIYENGLKFRDVGELGKTWKYVVGEEIHWEIGDNFELKYYDQFIVDNRPLKIEDETKIRQQLLNIGITNIPEYRIFVCYDND